MELIKMVMLHSGNQYAQDKISNYFSKWGISARTHSHIDLRNLTEVDAIAIHKRDFWDHYRFMDLPTKIRAITYTIGILNGFPEAFKFLSQAAEYFPLKESLTPELLSAVELSNPEAARARMGSLLIFWFADHFGGGNLRAIVPRILESISA